MGASLTNLAGGLARLLLSAAILFVNGPRLPGTGTWTQTHPPTTEHVDKRPDDGEKTGFHATVTIGRGEKEVTVQLEFGAEHAKGESL